MFSDNNTHKLIMLFIAMTVFTVIFVFFLIVSMIRLKNRQVKREAELLLTLIEERERTMYAISSEIHDNVNQLLSLARMSVRMIGKNSSPSQQKYIDECGTILDTVIGDLRNISHTLNTDYLKQKGLIESIQDEIKWINMSKSIQCVMNVEGDYIPMKGDVELMIVRIAQEAIHNVLKHSNADHLLVGIKYESAHFSMVVSDNGAGFIIDTNAPWNGVGLRSMQERAKIIQGDITIDSLPDVGTEVRLELNNPQNIKLPA